jgi:hypothetical protein
MRWCWTAASNTVLQLPISDQPRSTGSTAASAVRSMMA